MEKNIADLPQELSSKIFYYVGNASPYINELKNAVSTIRGLNCDDCHTLFNESEGYYYGSNSCFSDDEYYSYYLFTANNIYFINIGFYTDFGFYNYNRTMNISEALLTQITGRNCMTIEDYFRDIIIYKLKFNIFNINFIEGLLEINFDI